MKVQFSSIQLSAVSETAGNIAVLVFSDGKPVGAAASADAASGGAISRLLADPTFSAAPGKSAVLPHPHGLAARSLVVVGAGARKDVDAGVAREAGAVAAAAFGKAGGTIFAEGTFTGSGEEALIGEMALGAGLRTYRFDQYRTDAGCDPDAPPEPEPGPVAVALGKASTVEAAFAPRAAALAGVCLARDLVNEPANHLGTDEFAARIEELSGDGLEVEILNEPQLEKLGMRTLLAVGQGSPRESRVGVMRWRGGGDSGSAPLVLVGKGVVFDTGGISIKPSKGMEEMTMDMGGAAVVAGTMKALALRGARADVVGIVGLVENMPDGCAQRPGDVVTTMAGKTVEVINTDAEGRLVLVDLLHYAQDRFAPSAVIDLATLTGAMMVSLGVEKAGFFANDEELAAGLSSAAETEGEGLWRMPLGKEYAKALHSRVADLANVGSQPWGGAIAAAEFLRAFIRPDQVWAHLDIAGVTSQSSDQVLSPKGATGWGVRTLDRLVADRFEAS